MDQRPVGRWTRRVKKYKAYFLDKMTSMPTTKPTTKTANPAMALGVKNSCNVMMSLSD